MALFDNLIAYYKLDGNCRDSVNMYDGHPKDITFVDGKIGRGAHTNGYSQYISIPNEVSVKGRTQVSYSGWCFIESTPNEEFYIITEIANSSGYTRAAFGVTTNLLPFAGVRTVATGDSGSFQKVTSTSPMSTSTWYFLCAVFDLTNGNITLYVNGVSVDSLDVTVSSFVNSDPYRIRIFEFDGSGSGNVRVDEVGIWSKALSAAEVSELYNNGAGKTYSTGTSGGTGVVIDGLFLSTSKPTANQKGLLVNNKFFIPFAESSGSSGGTSAEYYKCASVNTSANTWSGYKAVFDSTAGMWSFESNVTEGLAYTSVTPIVGGIYSADALIKVSSMWNGVPSDNLVFYLPLSETTVADIGPDLTSSGTIVHTVMNGIPCAYFNGSSYLYASSVSMPTGASPRAMSLWFKYKDIPGATPSDAAVFAGWGTTTSLGRFDAYVEAQELYLIYSGSDLNTGIKIQDTNWHHILMQYNGATSEIYYDGQFVTSEAKTINTQNNYLYIGAREYGEYSFDGYLAGIRIYNRAMTSTEIAYLASEFTPSA